MVAYSLNRLAASPKQAEETVARLIDDTGHQARAAIDGDLAARVDVLRHQGEFRTFAG
jgi:hypothetical protein